jgi:uridine monophosphate synthetase
MSFFERLEQLAKERNSLLCVGLDPHQGDLPTPSAKAARDFCLKIIDATKDLAIAYKPNIAFFEVFDADGMVALKQVIAAIPEEIPVILDAKRGDISSTAAAYAQAAFEVFKADAITLNAYLGHDSISPFIQNPEKGVFLLCKTSNPGSSDLQDQKLVSGRTVYEQVAQSAKKWNTKDNVGLVVGATHPTALQNVRRTASNLWILAPGVGAQGGNLEEALRHGLRSDGLGLLFPVSRGISQAINPHHSAVNLNHKIKKTRKEWASRPPLPDTHHLTELAVNIYEAGSVKFGEFTLKSGLKSPVYIDLRQLASHPELLFQIASAYSLILESLTFDRLAAIPYAALPIGTAVSLQGNWPMIYPRKEVKEYGTKANIEGEYNPGERAVVIDDLTTTGGSKFEIIETLSYAGLDVKDIVVLIDRESGAAETLKNEGFRLHTVFTLTQLAEILRENRLITKQQKQAVVAFIKESATQ